MVQTALFETDRAVTLTDRQTVVYDALVAARQDGMTADEAGAIAHEHKDGRWAHSRDTRCEYCARDGASILTALNAKGLARYRRKRGNQLGAWLANTLEEATPADFGEFPEGY